MISMMDADGNVLGPNNLFSEFLAGDQDWKPFAFEFTPQEKTVAVRLHFLCAFPGKADVWIDDLSVEEVK
jgi:hypothetical protein